MKMIYDEESCEVPTIVSGNFFVSHNEPAVMIRHDKVKFNMACLKALPDTDYIHFAIYPHNKKMNVIPIGVDEQHGARWSSYSAAKRKPKEISCIDFTDRLYKLMEWSTYNRYKIIGKPIVDGGGKIIIAFDLCAALIFERIADGGMPRSLSQMSATDGYFGIPMDALTANPLVRRFAQDTEVIVGKENVNE